MRTRRSPRNQEILWRALGGVKPDASSAGAGIVTASIRGVPVLAKLYHGKPSAMTFANRTQADNAAMRVKASGARVTAQVVRWGRPWFVRILDSRIANEENGI